MRTIEVLQREMADGINDVLTGREKEFESNGIFPAMVVDHMETLGWEKGELETNGWQYDWWLEFTADGQSFTACGSGYYGTFEFSKTED